MIFNVFHPRYQGSHTTFGVGFGENFLARIILSLLSPPCHWNPLLTATRRHLKAIISTQRAIDTPMVVVGVCPCVWIDIENRRISIAEGIDACPYVLEQSEKLRCVTSFGLLSTSTRSSSWATQLHVSHYAQNIDKSECDTICPWLKTHGIEFLALALENQNIEWIVDDDIASFFNYRPVASYKGIYPANLQLVSYHRLDKCRSGINIIIVPAWKTERLEVSTMVSTVYEIAITIVQETCQVLGNNSS